ncbi:unnamed protein product [Camellia sinensis]
MVFDFGISNKQSPIMSSVISQLSSFSSISRRLHLHTRPCPTFRSEVLVVMNSDGSGTGISDIEGSAKSYATTSENGNGKGMNDPVQGHAVTQQIRAATIHDFCLGIPFEFRTGFAAEGSRQLGKDREGGLFLSGGLIGFIFTRNLTTLRTDALFGAALLSLSTLSLKVWRQGKSSFPFILGQAGRLDEVPARRIWNLSTSEFQTEFASKEDPRGRPSLKKIIAVALLWKNFQTYSMTKKLFQTGFYAAISAAMLCFYSYVVLSGGNPPPKKLKSSAVAPS